MELGTANYMNQLFWRVAGLIGAREPLRVAVLGLESSGKTVFLTSLANHILHHNPRLLRVKNARLVNRQSLLAGNRGNAPFPAFPYRQARKALAERRWPDATREPSLLRIPFDVHRMGLDERRFDLEILDIPGETVADFTMAGKSYAAWCAFMAQRFEQGLGLEGGYTHYLKTISHAGVSSKEQVLAAYRDFLGAEYANYVFAVVPSIVHLGRTGGHAETPEEFRKHLDTVALGVSRELEFAPLPVEALKDRSHPLNALARDFERGYDAYKRAKVDPLTDWFASAWKLYYLVNVLDILKMGPKRKNAEQRFGTAALEMFSRKSSYLGPLAVLGRVFGFFLETNIDRPRLVATQIDRVHSERNRSNMEDLVRKLFEQPLESLDFPGGKALVMSCAAVRTTSEGEGGALAYSAEAGIAPEASDKGYIPSNVPSDWPDSLAWQEAIDSKAFSFPDSGNIPFVDGSEDIPPPHLRMERIVEDLIYG